MPKKCELNAQNGIDKACSEDECPFWRATDFLHVAHSSGDGCAIQFFGLLGESGSEIATWLLSVKERMEAQQLARDLASIDPRDSNDSLPS